jgi:predicted kinase
MLKPNRNLIVLCGAPASGKSTLVRENNLEAYTVSFDAIRLE